MDHAGEKNGLATVLRKMENFNFFPDQIRQILVMSELSGANGVANARRLSFTLSQTV
jgi:hypothetical protein